MSAFDDEFGLFGDEQSEEERRSTLGARRIASDEAAHDDIEPEDERPRRGRRDRSAPPAGAGAAAEGEKPRRRERFESRDRGARKSADPEAAKQRGLDLLAFLARKLVSHPDEVLVETVDTDKGPVVELVVVNEDLGKVIGRGGRVAQALRTLVRATAETRMSVDIVSYEEDELEAEAEHAADIDPGTDETDEATAGEAEDGNGTPEPG